MVGRLLGRCGYRGTWLVTIGAIWMLFGVGALLTPLEPRPWALIEYAPALLRAGLWWATGLVALVVGIRGHQDDTPGHVALFIVPAVNVASFLVSFFVFATTSVISAFDPTVQVEGWAASWYAAIVWALVSVMLGLAAAWPNPVVPLPEPPPTAGDPGE